MFGGASSHFGRESKSGHASDHENGFYSGFLLGKSEIYQLLFSSSKLLILTEVIAGRFSFVPISNVCLLKFKIDHLLRFLEQSS